jgi:hypothetical protein
VPTPDRSELAVARSVTGGTLEATASWPLPADAAPASQPGPDRHGPGARCAFALLARLPQILVGLAAAIPVINSTIKAVHAQWVPAGDDGIIATRGWDVFTSHTPLIGQYSEAGLVLHGQIMHSPGPLQYWLLALPARFGSVTSIAVSMGVINTLAIIGCVALARRRGGVILMFATALGIALMCQSLPTEGMHDIWNPAAGLFPFLLLIFLGWSLACGDYRLLPITALVASFVTQTHLMYALPTAVVLAVGLGGLLLWRLGRRRSSGPEPRRPPPRIWPWALAALVIVAACWTPPAIDQIKNNPGNLATIVRTAEHRGATLGRAVGWHAVARSVGVTPWWLYVPGSEWERKGDLRATPSGTRASSTIALLAALFLAGLIGALRRRWDLASAALIGLLLCGAIYLEAASNPKTLLLAETLAYTMWWGSQLGFWVWLILAWGVWLGLAGLSRPALRALRTRMPDRRPVLPPGARLAAVALASLGALAGLVAVGSAVARTEKPDSHVYEYRSIRKIAAAIERHVPPGQTIDYRFGPLDLGTQPMEPSIRFFMVRHGDRVLAPRSFPRLGTYYELYDRPVQWIVELREGARPQPRMTLVARVRFSSPWAKELLSAWVQKVSPPAAPARVAAARGTHPIEATS